MTDACPSLVPAAPARFHLRRTSTAKQHVIRVHSDTSGKPGPLIAIATARRRRLPFKEQITLYRDESAREPVLVLQADRMIDVRSAMTVREPSGTVVGSLRKRGAASLLRSTWEVDQPGVPLIVVEERSVAVALLRRLWKVVSVIERVPVPWVIHVEGRAPSGEVVLTHTRRWGLRGRSMLEVRPPHDQRLAIALAISLCALPSP